MLSSIEKWKQNDLATRCWSISFFLLLLEKPKLLFCNQVTYINWSSLTKTYATFISQPSFISTLQHYIHRLYFSTSINLPVKTDNLPYWRHFYDKLTTQTYSVIPHKKKWAWSIKTFVIGEFWQFENKHSHQIVGCECRVSSFDGSFQAGVGDGVLLSLSHLFVLIMSRSLLYIQSIVFIIAASQSQSFMCKNHIHKHKTYIQRKSPIKRRFILRKFNKNMR